MKLKKVRALMAALALVVGTALCVSTVTWAKGLNPDPISIINEDGTIIKSAIESDRTLYLGSTQTQDIQSKILEKLCSADTIKKDSLTAKDVSITLKSELVFDEEKNEFVESENDIKDVMTVENDKVTFAKEGFFLAEVSINEDKLNVIFDVNEEILSYVDLNDWVVATGTSSTDFSVKYDSEKIATVKFDSSDVNVDAKGEYVLTYEITDANNKKIEKNVLVTVVEKETVNEYVEKGVWEAQTKIIINGNGLQSDKSYKNPVVKLEKPSKPNNSGNQNQNNQPEKPQHVHTFGDWQVKKPATCEKTGLEERFCTDTDCNKKEIRKIPTLGHDLKETVIAEPTCGTAGSKEITCSRCDFKDTKEIPATGNHAYGDWVIVKEATCTEDGLKTRHCQNDDCNEVESEVIPATGHTFGDWKVTTPATCETEGQEERTCESCKETETRVIKALGHEFVDYTYNNDATCEKDGTEAAKCTRCDKTDTRIAEGTKLGHELKEEILTNPTCETAGSKKITCSRCDYEEIVEIPAIGHKWNDGEVTTAPTCTTEGVKTFTCQNDPSHTRTEVIPALGHDLKETIVKAPTCTEAGSKKVACTRCDYEDSQVEIPALGHKWDDGVVTKTPTCTEAGVKTFTCQNDKNHTRTEVIPATGHDLKEEVIKPATCTEKGEIKVTCANCDFEEIKETESFGHDMDEGVVTTQPTCTTDGVKTFTCKHGCGYTTTEVIKATGHKFGDWVTTKEPSCTATGEKTRTCSSCGNKETEVIPALGHHMTNWSTIQAPTCLVNGVQERHCTRCNHKETQSVSMIPHNWVEDYGKKWVSYDECRKCGFQTEDEDEIALHCLECDSTYTTKKKQVDILLGHHCTGCGQKDY